MSLRKKTFSKGEILIKEGAEDKSMFYILSGTVNVFAKSPNRNVKSSVNELVKGDLVGELSFFDGLPRSATLVAKEETEVMIIDRGFFDGLKPDHLKIIKAMARKIRKLNDRIVSLDNFYED